MSFTSTAARAARAAAGWGGHGAGGDKRGPGGPPRAPHLALEKPRGGLTVASLSQHLPPRGVPPTAPPQGALSILPKGDCWLLP